ncbi:MAG: hypothetical protein PX637_12605 [Microcystis sp. M53601_WE4]|nr:hypothetical protein [Microcystis sp. M53601_WE4]
MSSWSKAIVTAIYLRYRQQWVLFYYSSQNRVSIQESGDRRLRDRRQETGDRRQEIGDSFILPTPHTPLPHFPTPHTPLPHLPKIPEIIR